MVPLGLGTSEWKVMPAQACVWSQRALASDSVTFSRGGIASPPAGMKPSTRVHVCLWPAGGDHEDESSTGAGWAANMAWTWPGGCKKVMLGRKKAIPCAHWSNCDAPPVQNEPVRPKSFALSAASACASIQSIRSDASLRARWKSCVPALVSRLTTPPPKPGTGGLFRSPRAAATPPVAPTCTSVRNLSVGKPASIAFWASAALRPELSGKA
mmetsp:Transcript_71380/g.158695  ORF Transcript_71380/g.158695 Transcript_71380/m.158695 type:complete len:212 (-) Transcript_71380:51-686(-)